MRPYDIIKKKRDGYALTTEEINFLIDGYVNNIIPDYQISAFLMAVYFRGMNIEETTILTMAMMNSGEVLNLNDIHGIKIDKHSTGGVGDKITLILAPLVAAAGVNIPMLSGRGLGHTGGTLDKLESIPGFRTDLSNAEFKENIKNNHLCIIGQSPTIAPADGKLYALRDVTATVDSIPLIASSIMSKKLAAGIDGLVLDVKTGRGAFIKEYEKSLKLAETMVKIGNKMGKKIVALITDMDQPLGYKIGNALEVEESVMTLKGEGPADLVEITLELSAWMLKLAGRIDKIEEGKQIINELIENGKGLEKFKQMVELQGGSVEVIEDLKLLPKARDIVDIKSSQQGYIRHLDAELIGISAMLLGAGREKLDSKIDHAVGIILKKKVGDFVKGGETIAVFHYNEEEKLKEAKEKFLSAYCIGDEKPVPKPMVKAVIT